MAKKKSKTQKQKKNLKKKIDKVTTTSQVISKNTNVPKTNTTKKQNTPTVKRKIVPKEDVEYKIFQHPEQPKRKPVTKKSVPKKILVNRNNVLYELFNPSKTPKRKNNNSYLTKISTFFKQTFSNFFKKKSQKEKVVRKNIQEEELELPKRKEVPKPKNTFLRLLFEIYHSSYVFFNTIILLVFIILIVGLKTVNVFSNSIILYIGAILLFLIIVAISYNKYISGKVFTIILTGIMSFGIYHLQYTYDFIRGLNHQQYEYKEYYVVTFNNSSNRSIYNINNKKVGLISDNSVNIERVLNTKLDSVKYIEFNNQEDLFSAFYNNEFRAIIITENQYKYLKNNKANPNQDVKKLYSFDVVTRKQ